METLKKPNLFWDIDRDKLDPASHGDFIVKRILERGDIEDFKWAVDQYGRDFVAEVFSKNSEKFDLKSNNFWCFYFNLDKSKCIRKQSTKKQSPFWRR
ncbi:MAG TPA: hypothetical protein DIT25_04570 [Candidatus Moranbacteria bacterium]|nr:hypothetical protein [Candidatus Moranbacteria bacterium]